MDKFISSICSMVNMMILYIKVTIVHRRLWLEAGEHNHHQNDNVLNSKQKKQRICEWKCWILIMVLAERTTDFFVICIIWCYRRAFKKNVQ
jgi:hypothetical protein